MTFPVIDRAKAEAIQVAIDADTVLAADIRAELANEVATLTESIADVQTQIDTIDSRLTDIDATLATHTGAIATLSSDLLLLTGRVDSLEIEVPLKVYQSDYDIVIDNIITRLTALEP